MQALHDFWVYVPPPMRYVVIALVIFAIATAIGVYKLLNKKYVVKHGRLESLLNQLDDD